MKIEQTECSETSAYRLQTPSNYPKESVQHTEHGESLKSRKHILLGNVYRYSFGSGLILWYVIGNGKFSFALRKERRLRVFENRVLGIIFGPKRGEVTGEWRKIHNEELNDLYCFPYIVQVCTTYLHNRLVCRHDIDNVK